MNYSLCRLILLDLRSVQFTVRYNTSTLFMQSLFVSRLHRVKSKNRHCCELLQLKVGAVSIDCTEFSINNTYVRYITPLDLQ
jgi:hypothetical protein